MSLRAETTRSILISYSRRDREQVIKLYQDLEDLDFTLWRDIHNIPDGEPFWEEIKAGIDACESVVLCLSDESRQSEWVQREWQYARQQGKRVVPVVVKDVNFNELPRWMGRASWSDFREGVKERGKKWTTFIRTLNTPYEGRKVPFMADRLPDYFVNRPDEFEKIVSALVDSNGAVAITAAVKGAGGFGKTTLTLALCHDTRVRGAFDDGILWVTLGEKPTQADLIRYALDLCELLTGERPTLETKEAVKTELSKAIGDRYILLVMDDLWRKNDADIFLTDSPNSAVLVTTRYNQQLPDKTHFKQDVDAMKTDEAVKLLSWGIDTINDQHTEALQNLTERLGEWAVILRLANATLRKDIERGASLENALEDVNADLNEEGLVAFDDDNLDEEENKKRRDYAVKATVNVSLKLLSDKEQSAFAKLAIFPEDVDIPFTTLAQVWNVKNKRRVKKLTDAIQDSALLQGYDLSARTIRLHDVIRQYLIDEYTTDLKTWQAEFVANLADLTQLSNEYEWRNIGYHLQQADQLDTLRTLLLDFNFLQSKLSATDPNALIADCDVYLSSHVVEKSLQVLPDTMRGDLEEELRPIQLIQSALSISSHILSQSPDQLSSQVVGRLGLHDECDELCRVAIAYETHGMNLQLLFPTLKPAGRALMRLLKGHTRIVNSVALSGEFAVSTSMEKTLRVWNWQTGEALRTLDGHTHIVNSVALSGDFAVSTSDDNTLRVWNWRTGEHLRLLKGHKKFVNSVALSGDFAVSTSSDNTLRVWNWRTGEHLRLLKGHTGRVNSVALSGDFAVSVSGDNTLRVWNWKVIDTPNSWFTDDYLRTLEGHTDSVTSVALSGDFAVSASNDNTLRVWNWQTGEPQRMLEGHTGRVTSVALSGDFAVSGSWDNTLHVWNWKNVYRSGVSMSSSLQGFEAHTGGVTSMTLSGDFVVSDSSDRTTLRVWNWQTGEPQRMLKGHTGGVTSMALSGDFVVSASYDNMVYVWNWQTGEALQRFKGHTDYYRRYQGRIDYYKSVALSGDFVVSASSDGTLYVWNWKTGKQQRRFKEHEGSVNSVALSGDFAVSASGTLLVWNWKTGKRQRRLKGHTGRVNSVALSGDFAVSASGGPYDNDNTLRVWNWQTGELIRTLKGHTSRVNSVVLLVDFALSVSDDNTLRVWNWQTGELITTFYADSSQYAVAVAPDFERVICSGKSKQGHFLRPNRALLKLLHGEKSSI